MTSTRTSHQEQWTKFSTPIARKGNANGRLGFPSRRGSHRLAAIRQRRDRHRDLPQARWLQGRAKSLADDARRDHQRGEDFKSSRTRRGRLPYWHEVEL